MNENLTYATKTKNVKAGSLAYKRQFCSRDQMWANKKCTTHLTVFVSFLGTSGFIEPINTAGRKEITPARDGANGFNCECVCAD